MSLFSTCAKIADRYAMIDQIASDGVAYLVPGNEQIKREIPMQLHEAIDGIVVCNNQEIDLTEWAPYLKENHSVKLYDSTGRYEIIDLDGDFQHEDVQYAIAEAELFLGISLVNER